MRPLVFNVKPIGSLQDNSKEGPTVQMGMKSKMEQGYHSLPLNKEVINGPDKHLKSVMLGLRLVSVGAPSMGRH